MKQSNLSAIEQSVLSAVQKEHLTSYQILKKVDNVPMLLSLYNVLDNLKSKGVLRSYVKKDVKYHCAC